MKFAAPQALMIQSAHRRSMKAWTFLHLFCKSIFSSLWLLASLETIFRLSTCDSNVIVFVAGQNQTRFLTFSESLSLALQIVSRNAGNLYVTDFCFDLLLMSTKFEFERKSLKFFHCVCCGIHLYWTTKPWHSFTADTNLFNIFRISVIFHENNRNARFHRLL